MTAVQIIEAARRKLPYLAEFEHDVIRVPVSDKDIASSLLQNDEYSTYENHFYEVEFRKEYIKSVAVGWEFVKIY